MLKHGFQALFGSSPCRNFPRFFQTPASPKVSEDEINQFKEKISCLGTGNIRFGADNSTGLARIVIENPEMRNAMSGKMMVQLNEAVEYLERWDSGVAVVLVGKGLKAFCAGADLSLAREHLTTASDGSLMCALMTDTLNRLRALPLISIAAIEGGAIGGGAELSTACDFRVVSPRAHIQFVHVKMGISPGWGGGARLTKILGARQALRLLAWGDSISAHEALKIGLADMMSEEDETAEEAALRMLQPLLQQPNRNALRAVKATVTASNFIQEEILIAERTFFSSVWGGNANRAALTKTSSEVPLRKS